MSWLVPKPARIVEKRSFGPDIHSYQLRLQDPADRAGFDFVPGQFNMVSVPGVGEVAISVSSDPDEELLEHTIRIVGRTTRAIEKLSVGDTLGLRGPYGRGWPLQEVRGSDVMVVTGGLGCAPVTGAIDYLFRRRADYGRITILHGVKKPADLVFRERFEAWRREHDAVVLLASDTADRHWRDRTGVVTELFHEVAFEPARSVLLMCGPEVMMRHATRILRGRGLSDGRIWLSLERNMHCALGVCGHCQLGPFLLCRDGPIFRSSQIRPFFEIENL